MRLPLLVVFFPLLALAQPAPPPQLEQEPRLSAPSAPTRPFQEVRAPAVDMSPTGTSSGVVDPAHPDVPTPDVLGLGGAVVAAIVARHWTLAVVGALMLGVLLLRSVGARFFPVLATGRGAAWLTVGLGTLTALFTALQRGDPSVPVLLMASASGFWSWGQSLGLFTPKAPKPPA